MIELIESVRSGGTMKNIVKGKRYWFKDRSCVYSGLYARDDDKRNDCIILVRRNGDEWSIKKKDLFESKEKLLESVEYKKHLIFCDRK